MKRCLVVLITFCTLFNSSYGQSSSAAIDSLVKFHVITVKERPMLEKELKEQGVASYRAAILGGLEEIILQKTFHVDPRRTGIMVSYRNDGPPNKKIQDSINTSLRQLLEKIKKADLLSDRVYSYTLNGIDSGTYMVDVQLIGVLAGMSSRLEWLKPGRLLPVAEELHKNGIVSDSSFILLKNNINNGKIESAYQLNDYCRLDRTFDLTKYPDDPDIWLEQLHRDIASILPGLNFTDFNYTIINDTSSFGSLMQYRFIVSLKCGGRIYKYASSPFFRKPDEAKVSPRNIFIADFYRIFNKILTDQQSPFRLHHLMFSHVGSAGDNLHQFALIALREEQTKVFFRKPCLTYMLLGIENYDNTLTSAKVDSVIAGWKKIGLFANLSDQQISKAIDDAKADNLFSIDNLLANFPGVIYSRNSGVASSEYTYTDELIHLAGIAHGLFNPTHITQKKIKGGLKLQYLAEGRLHSYTFQSKYSWLDSGFPVFVKGLGIENNLPGNFYQLADWSGIIFLTTQQHDDAVKDKLLDFEDDHPRHR